MKIRTTRVLPAIVPAESLAAVEVQRAHAFGDEDMVEVRLSLHDGAAIVLSASLTEAESFASQLQHQADRLRVDGEVRARRSWMR